ncbi:serine hydrolase domain-containing protein [Streptomyces violaceus]|uniref:Serine hydrolase domain-containing protein n=1 Tax=Streptomyces violaceus TaxID=1936 RepID=A0ABY9UBB2_STRVL|nr:serine hydrolase domain-containing protein [Streptomyces janthinus]WND20080.1 serine hydrolase domain-containing protein [Streptomyces janthinus]GGS63415.1 D-alanyl-D-alanine carboxypeptidase [Streptomyces janthinus]
MAHHGQQKSSRLLLTALTALTALAGLAMLAVATTALAGPSHPPPPRLPAKGHATHQKTQAVLNEIAAQGTPGVIAQVRDRHGVWDGRAGVRKLGSEQPRSTHDRFRIASVTKTFTATVLLKLEAEGKLSLDDSVAKWLPGVVHGKWYDKGQGKRHEKRHEKRYRPRYITVRHLLNHTSGIFDYNMDAGFRAKYAGDEFDRNRHVRWSPEDLVDIALAHPPNFQPEQGSRPGRPGKWDYSDTNYVLAGMVIEKATGRSYAHEVERLVIRPLGLRGTSVPGTSPRLPSPHARHYSTLFEDGPRAKVRDVTEFSPTVAFSAGQMISTVGDVNTFLSRLLAGELLPPKQQRQLLDAVPVDGDKGHGGPQDVYGLGLRHFKLVEGCWAWGHGGMIPGSATRTLASADGRQVMTMNRNGDWGEQRLEDAAVETEFCRSTP